VPYGNVWRTGANNATTLTFGDEVIIGGKKIPAGNMACLQYRQRQLVLIITKQLDVTSPSAYKETEDVVRVDVKPVNISYKIETFTMQFAEVKPSSCELQLLWENTAVILPITTDVDAKVMKQIDNLMNKDNLPILMQRCIIWIMVRI
jgi:hypothetical protein